MAAPVIESVTPAVVNLSPGQFVDVVVVASDPDSATGSGVFPVIDSQGNVTNATVDLTLDEPLTFGAGENPDALSITIQQITATATDAIYRVTAV